jgi:hypothetical protein
MIGIQDLKGATAEFGALSGGCLSFGNGEGKTEFRCSKRFFLCEKKQKKIYSPLIFLLLLL